MSEKPTSIYLRSHSNKDDKNAKDVMLTVIMTRKIQLLFFNYSRKGGPILWRESQPAVDIFKMDKSKTIIWKSVEFLPNKFLLYNQDNNSFV
jgi:hypothetical protein